MIRRTFIRVYAGGVASGGTWVILGEKAFSTLPYKRMRHHPLAEATGPLPTLGEALRETAQHRWRTQRTAARTIGQAVVAVAALERIVNERRPARSRTRKITVEGGFTFEVTEPRPQAAVRANEPGHSLVADEVTTADIRIAVREWEAEGLAPASIHIRLTCLSVLGVKVRGCYPKLPRKLKWWLRPDQQVLALKWLRAHVRLDRPSITVERYHQLADLLEFITLTGLRVEEALRLTWPDVVQRPTRTVLAVPGTKTKEAQRTLPISAAAADVLARRRGLHEFKVFPIEYQQMGIAWRECREHIGLENPREATLKAFRRNAARSLTTGGMPTAILKEYLGHSKMDTTLGYLKLTGGYSEEEFGKWL